MAALLLVTLAGGVTFAPAVQAGTIQGQTQVQLIPTGALTNTAPLDFGRVIPGNAASRVRIAGTSDTITRDSGNAVLAGGPISRARFQSVNAIPVTLLLTIAVPTTPVTLTRSGGTQTMQVTNFTLDGASTRLIVLGNVVTFHVGGTLNVNANQAPGHYTGTFNVVTNYP